MLPGVNGLQDRVCAVRNRRQTENVVVHDRHVELEKVAKRSLRFAHAWLDVALQDQLGAGGDVEVHRDAARHRHWLAAQSASQLQLVVAKGKRGGRGQEIEWEIADGHGDW